MTGGAGASFGSMMPMDTLVEVIADLGRRGLKVEHWQTAVGTTPITTNTSYLQAEFYPNNIWPVSGMT
jgi:hypothetical protein